MKFAMSVSKPILVKTTGLALVAALTVSFIGFSFAATTHQLTVNVSDICGPVVAQATIVNGPDDGAFGITNANGSYTFTSLNEGVFYVHIAAADHASKDTGSIVLTSDQTVNVVLDRTNSSCTGSGSTHKLTVNVSDICGPVVAQATIVNGPDDGAFGITNANGSYTFTSLNEGVFYVHVASANHTSKDTSAITLTSDQTVSVTLDRTNGGCITGGGNTFSLTVNVNDICGVISGASLTLVGGPQNGSTGTTNSSGRFVFTNLDPANNLHVHATATNHTAKDSANINLDSDQTVSVTLDRTNGGCTTGGGNACLENAAVTLTGPATLNPGQTGTFNAHILNNGQTWWYHGSYFQFVQNTSFSINPTFGQYTPSMHTTDTRDFSFVLTAPTTPGTYTLRMQNVHRAGADYEVDNGTVCAAAPSHDVLFGQEGAATFTVNAATGPTNHAPIGSLDEATCDIIGGWSVDMDTPTQPNAVHIYYDGSTVGDHFLTEIYPNTQRDDVNNGLGITGVHGFSLTTPAILKDGNAHTVYAYGIDTAPGHALNFLLVGSPKTIKCVTAPVNHAPIGSLDEATCDIIGGWSVDMDTPTQPNAVHIYYDGPAGSGHFLTEIYPNTQRDDVNAQLGITGKHGFSLSTPPVLRDGNAHTVYAYGIDSDPSHSLNFLLTGSPISVKCVTIAVNHAPIGSFDKLECDILGGWSVDMDTPSQANPVHLYYDGPAGSGHFLAEVYPNTQRDDVNAQLGITGVHGFSLITPAVLKDGNTHTVYAYGIDTEPSHSLNFLLTGSPRTIKCVTTTPTTSLTIVKTARDVTAGQTSFADTISANPGDNVEFQIQVTAHGNTDAQSVSVTDTLPANLSLTSGALTNNLGNMSVNSTKTVTLTAHIDNASSFTCGTNDRTNSATAQATNASAVTDTAKVTITRTTDCGGGNANLTIVKTVRNLTQGQIAFVDSVNAVPGDQVEFQLQVTNTGTVSAPNATVVDALPSNLALNSGSLNTNLGTLNAGVVKTVTLKAALVSEFTCGSHTVTNSASAHADNTGTVSDTATMVVTQNDNCGCGSCGNPNANLTLTKEVENLTQNTQFSSSVNANVNDRVEFRLTIRNTNSTVGALNVRVHDILPSGLAYIPGTFQTDFSASGDLFNGSEFVGLINPLTTRTIWFQVNVNSTGTMINNASATSDNSLTATGQATVFVNNGGGCTVNCVLGNNVNLVYTKKAYNQTQNADATVVTAHSGDVIVYTLTVQNTGNANATGFVFQDNLSDVLQLSMLRDFGSAAFNQGALTLTWPAVNINANASASQSFSVRVNDTFGAGTDNVMTNVFGNTVNVNVQKPTVLGVFTAPKTGATSTLAFVFAALSVVGFAAWKKKAQLTTLLSWIKS